MALYFTLSIGVTGMWIVDKALDGSLCNGVYSRNRYFDCRQGARWLSM